MDKAMNTNLMYLNDICNRLNITITHIFHNLLDEKWHFDNHTGNFNRIYFILGGEGYLYNKNERVKLEPYNIYIIPADSVYNYRCSGYMDQLFIHFKIRIVPDKDILSHLNHIITVRSTKEQLESIRDTFYKQDIHAAILCQNIIRTIVSDNINEIIDDVNNDIKVYRKYCDIFEYIDSNLSANLSVGQVCRSLRLSQTYIGRQFKEDTGSTIKKYITNLLVEKMKNMLQLGYTVQRIADELQFNDVTYCSKFFTKHMGITPKKYSKNHVLK